jgi:hypothetical protein
MYYYIFISNKRSMKTAVQPKNLKYTQSHFGLRITRFVVTYFIIVSAIVRSAPIHESYLIEPLSDQSFLVVRRPLDLNNSTVFELMAENLQIKWTKLLYFNESIV